ncbi:hypothetical protein CON64_13605 [Bacillus pseudomycoides]|nr:hypothetical protein CON64_13605 [Bacillus pseudomycoides]
MNLIHQEFPEAEKWSLDTSKDNIRNHHFYEKCRYKVVGEHQINDKLILLDYEMKNYVINQNIGRIKLCVN